MTKTPRRATLTAYPKHGKIDMSTWTLDTLDSLQDAFSDAILKAVGEVVELLLKDEDTYIMFPAEWHPDSDGVSGKSPKDAMTVYLRLPIDSGEPATYQFSLRDALADTLETCGDGSFAPGLARIRDGFRELADEIDKAIKAHA